LRKLIPVGRAADRRSVTGFAPSAEGVEDFVSYGLVVYVQQADAEFFAERHGATDRA